MLAISNLTHRKVRSGLSILAVAIAITLLLILVGLSNGTLNEVSDRMQSVDAEIVVRDKHFDLGSISGGKLWEKEMATIAGLQIDSQLAVEKTDNNAPCERLRISNDLERLKETLWNFQL